LVSYAFVGHISEIHIKRVKMHNQKSVNEDPFKGKRKRPKHKKNPRPNKWRESPNRDQTNPTPRIHAMG
jgi:hypothetical protein